MITRWEVKEESCRQATRSASWHRAAFASSAYTQQDTLDLARQPTPTSQTEVSKNTHAEWAAPDSMPPIWVFPLTQTEKGKT